MSGAGTIRVTAPAGGRRRAGRRWPAGETAVQEGDLSEVDVAQLEADPALTVTREPAPVSKPASSAKKRAAPTADETKP